MKKLIQALLPLIISSKLFAIAGFGVYGNYDLLKYPSGSDIDGTMGVNYEGFNNAAGVGFLFYIDVIPVVDLEVDIEFVGNLYKFTPYTALGNLTSGEMPWGRTSTYLTVRKEIIGLSIPLLAKAQLYGGLGINKHTVLPVMNLAMFKSAFATADIETALNKDFNNSDVLDKLSDYMLENADKISGFHLQTGLRGKLLMLNVFVNARYTIAKDVIPDKSGYPSMWIGLAFGI